MSTLLTIAPEVRNRIYEELFNSKRVDLITEPWPFSIKSGFPQFAKIMLVSRQTYTEASRVFYARNIFGCDNAFNFLKAIDASGRPRYHQFENVLILGSDRSSMIEASKS